MAASTGLSKLLVPTYSQAQKTRLCRECGRSMVSVDDEKSILGPIIRQQLSHEINAVATLEAIERLLLRDLPRDVTVSQARESIAVTSIPQGAP